MNAEANAQQGLAPPGPTAPCKEAVGKGGEVQRVPAIPDHELIRLIGQGAYGEVWLARNVLGTHRAVKMVYRDRFKEAQPFEREFEGIRRFEPVSRSDPGLMDILQIGRNEIEGYFYYIMELADDAYAPVGPNAGDDPGGCLAPEVDPANYVPKTLSCLLADRVRLPVPECLALGLALTRSLQVLHGNGLLHRDVKPSNIIFVQGVPKLADIGLLAKVGEAHTLVGTEGFMAPEGPNSEQGDLYGLGKVLYEATTGKDRHQFPEPMSQVAADPDASRLMELNAVIVRASENDVRRRYATASEMLAELEMIRVGKSVRRKRSRQRLIRQSVRGGLGLLLLSTALLALDPFLNRREVRSGPPPVLTQLAIPTLHFDFSEHRDTDYDFSPDGTRMILTRGGSLFAWEKATGVERPLEVEMSAWYLKSPRYSPDGRLIACVASRPSLDPTGQPGRAETVLFLNADGTVARHLTEPVWIQLSRPFWRPDGSAILYHSERGAIEFTLSGSRTDRPELPLTQRLSRSCISPDGRWIATGRKAEGARDAFDTDLWLLPAAGGQAIQLTRQQGFDGNPIFNAPGDALYYVSSEGSDSQTAWNIRKIHIAKATGVPLGESEPITHFEDACVLFPQLIAKGSQLVFAVKTGADLLWVLDESSAGAKPRPIVRGESGLLSPDGQDVVYIDRSPARRGIFRAPVGGGAPQRLVDEREYPLESFAFGPPFDLSPDGQCLAFAAARGPRRTIYKVSVPGQTPPEPLVTIPDNHRVLPKWSPDGGHLAYAIDGELIIMRADGSERRTVGRLFRWQSDSLHWSPDGTEIAAFGYASPEDWTESVAVFVVAANGSGMRRVTPVEEKEYKEGLSWHPDGERLTYMRYGPGRFGAEIRWAFADGRPTERFIDTPGRWDWIGSWAPDGERFFFLSATEEDGQRQFVYNLSNGTIEPASEDLGVSLSWSRDGKTRLWSTARQQKQFWMAEGFQ